MATKIIKHILGTFGTSKATSIDEFKASAQTEINKIVASQDKCHQEYSEAGFPANNITSMIVQRQLSQG